MPGLSNLSTQSNGSHPFDIAEELDSARPSKPSGPSRDAERDSRAELGIERCRLVRLVPFGAPDIGASQWIDVPPTPALTPQLRVRRTAQRSSTGSGRVPRSQVRVVPYRC